MENVRCYPVGKFVAQDSYSESDIQVILSDVKSFPEALKSYLQHVPESAWDTPYRKDGWTVRQVIHHLADSHMMMYIRVKLTLSMNKPTVPGYPEKTWAEMPDNALSPWVSVGLLESIHQRLVHLLENSDSSIWHELAYFHSGYETWNPIDRVLALYQWHGKHHLAHIKLAVENPENV